MEREGEREREGEGGGGGGRGRGRGRGRSRAMSGVFCLVFIVCCHFFFLEMYSNKRVWQVDIRIPRMNRGVKGQDGSAPIRDKTHLWEGGVIPYSLDYSMSK